MACLGVLAVGIAQPAGAEEANPTPTLEPRLPAPQGPARAEMEETLQRLIWENENLQAKLKLLREALTERAGALEANHGKLEQLEAKLGNLQQTLQDAVDQQASSQAQRALCDSAREELTRELQEWQGRAGAVKQENRDLQLRLAEREQELLEIGAQRDGLSTKTQALQETIAELESEREVSAQTLAELRAERDSLQVAHAALRARLGPVHGGNADLRSARDVAAESAADYNALAKEEVAGTQEGAERSTELRQAGQNLLAAQSLLALLAEARAIYTVQPNDSLSTIAGALYGDVHRWSEIFRANRHVLGDPNRIARGMVLVIP